MKRRPLHPAVKAVTHYIDTNYEHEISLDELAKLTKLNKYYLRDRFKKQVGCSPHSYQRTIRVKHARRLLEKGHAPALVAAQVGLADQSHLNRLLKQHIGFTSSQFLKRAQPESHRVQP